MKTEVVNTRMTKQDADKLIKLAERSKRTIGDYVRLVLLSAIEKKVKV